MYKLSVPIMLRNEDFEKYSDRFIEQCKEAGVDRVFLCSTTWRSPESEKQRLIKLLKKYVPIYKSHGFEVGTWMGSLGHGGTCGNPAHTVLTDGLQRMVSLEGQMNMDAYCPLCENFQELAKDWIRRVAETGVELIMLDDDYRYSFHGGGIYCACEKHQKLFTEELGEPFDAKRMKEALTTGGPNKWRDTWLRVQGQTLTDFAQMLRDALNEVNPNVRLSICSVLSTWDVDGVDSVTLAKTFAGDTAPFLRLIGAAYWAALRSFQGIRMAAVCEYERLQQFWCKDSGVEIFSEGDSYPRPRYNVPAVYMEGLDTVMRASGTGNGILKYMMDYFSSPDYETGYLDRHNENKPLYQMLESRIAPKEAVGVTVFAPMKTLAVSHRPGDSLDNRCIPAVLRFATDNSLPIQYEDGENAAIIFGDAGELAGDQQLKHGAVLDITAAEALTRRGYDVGLVKVNGAFVPNQERFTAEDEKTTVNGGVWYDVEIAETAGVDSWQVGTEADGTRRMVPAVYTYENAAGQKFAVYCFHAQESFELTGTWGLFRTWCRASQLRRLLPWLSGRKLDAICDGAPDLYIMTKRDEDSLSVALWNFGEDYIKQPVVRLGEEWSEIVCDWGSAKLNGTAVEVEKMPAFSFECFTLKK